jgi:hypothetical protein
MQPKESEKPTPKKEKRKKLTYMQLQKKVRRGKREKKKPNKLLTCDYKLHYM